MNKLKRRLFFLFFFLLFLVTVPLVVLFVQGYRFDKDNGIFVYSGSIAIKSWPKDIDVFLDGEKYSVQKSGLVNEIFIINGLRPGKYQLRCQKEGYSSWEKSVEVHSGVSTEFWNVLLFPLPDKVEKTSYSPTQESHRFFLSPRDNNEVVFSQDEAGLKKISLLDVEEGQAEEIFSVADDWKLPAPEDKENVEWSTDNQSLLIPMRDVLGEREYFIGKIKKDQLEKPIRLSEIFDSKEAVPTQDVKKNAPTAFQKVRWMFDKNDELVVLTKKQELFYLNIKKPEEKILLAENVSDFDFAGNRIYYAQNPNNLVWEIKDNDVATKRQITKTAFISENNDEFIDLKVYDEYRLTMINSSGHLFIFNQEKEKNETTNEEIQGGFIDSQFANDGKKLLFWSNHEIWVFFLRDWEVQPIREKNEKKLIVRFSQPLKNVQWMETYENVIFSSGNWIKSAEIDMRNGINITNVLERKEPWQENEAIYDKDSQTLFYLDKDSSQKNFLHSILFFEKKTFLGF